MGLRGERTIVANAESLCCFKVNPSVRAEVLLMKIARTIDTSAK